MLCETARGREWVRMMRCDARPATAAMATPYTGAAQAQAWEIVNWVGKGCAHRTVVVADDLSCVQEELQLGEGEEGDTSPTLVRLCTFSKKNTSRPCGFLI